MATMHDPRSIHEALIRKIAALPRARITEVEDFVDFIGQRESAAADKALADAARAVSAPALARIWSNPDDDVYDAV